MEKKVRILLSSYNGMGYLEKQIESIYQLKDIAISLLVRDDGSDINNVNYLNKLKEKYHFDLILGSNKGVTESFRELLIKAGDYDFYAFCDQDDYWKSEKIKNAVSLLESSKSDLYFSNVSIVDHNLNFMTKSTKRFEYDLFDVIQSNKATGCTIVITREYRKFALRYFKPNRKYLHDWFLTSLAIYSNRGIVFDSNSYVLYRQHSANVVGSKRKFSQAIKSVFSNKETYIRNQLVTDLLEIDYLVDESNIHILQLIKTYKIDKESKVKLIEHAKTKIGLKKTFWRFLLKIWFKKF